MSRIRNMLLVLSFTFISGCETAKLVAEAEPVFINSISGPTDIFNDLDFKLARADVDVKVFSEAKIILVYANSENQLRSINSVKIMPECTSQGTIRSCRAQIPSAIDKSAPVFSVGDTVFYQWFVEYGDAGGVKGSNVASFEIGLATSCPFSAIGQGLGAAECDNTRACVSVSLFLLGTPGLESVPRCVVPSS